VVKLTPVKKQRRIIWKMDKLMSQKEVKRSQILDRLREGKISQQEAAQQMDISTRPARRLAKRYQREGLAGLISKKAAALRITGSMELSVPQSSS
jgi:predicted transcriptional regulator